MFQGQGPVQGQAQGDGQLPHQVQQPGLQEASLLDLDQPEPFVPALPAAPLPSEDETFNPISSSSHSLHGVVGDLPSAGTMQTLLIDLSPDFFC